ncbi:MAG TPA: YceI family protein [Mucilaginibacter sp.]|nr:YceI family protein [Mucilaginibacter sp.]
MKTQSKRSFKGIIALPCIFFFLLSIQTLQAQVAYKLSASKDNVVKVLGSSNVHDWTMIAQKPVCEAEFGALSGEVPKKLGSLSFSVEAKNLKSEHESMDGRTYKTIKADTYPRIVFKLNSATITPGQKDNFIIQATGSLTIAGVSQVITMQVSGLVNPDKTITCTGQQKLKLTDYKIDPPSFMLGAMKVKNDLTIQFSLNLVKTETNKITATN